MPSFSSSPWRGGAPHSGLACDMVRIRARTSYGITGRPIRWRLFQAQKRRNARRCHAMTVSGRTITIAERHSVQIRDATPKAAGRLASGGHAGGVIVEEPEVDAA